MNKSNRDMKDPVTYFASLKLLSFKKETKDDSLTVNRIVEEFKKYL